MFIIIIRTAYTNYCFAILQKGQSVDIPSELPELNISVVEVPIQFVPGDMAPHRVGDVTQHTRVTTGRPGGAE